MHRVPDLTRSGLAEPLHVRSVKASRRPAMFDFDVVLTWTLTEEALGILPEPLRFLRAALLQAYSGGLTISPFTIALGLEGAFNLDALTGDNRERLIEGLRGTVRSVSVAASERKVVLTWRLRIGAPSAYAGSFLELLESDVAVVVELAEGQRQPDLFTREADLPEADPELPLEAGEEVEAAPPKRRRKPKAEQPVAEA